MSQPGLSRGIAHGVKRERFTPSRAVYASTRHACPHHVILNCSLSCPSGQRGASHCLRWLRSDFLRITHIITEAWALGGAQLNTLYSLRYQRAHNDVELIAGGFGPLVEACGEEGIPVTIIPMTNRVWSPAADARSLASLVPHLARTKPDIVHTHSSKAGILGRLAARLARVPVVIHTVHGPPFHERQSTLERGLLQLAERSAAMLSDQLLTVSDTMAQNFVAARICEPEKISTVVSGIDFGRFPATPFSGRDRIRAEFGAGPQDLLVVNVALLSKQKSHADLIRVATLLRDRHTNLKYLIVGDGPLEPELRQLVETSAVDDIVKLVGRRNDVPEILASSDIFIQTSVREGLSRSLVEALYSRLAVVATDVGSTREVVRDGVTGLLVPTEAVRDMADAIARLAADPALRRRLGQAGRAQVGDSRTVEAMGLALDRIYKRNLSDNTAGGTVGVTGKESGKASARIVFVVDTLRPGGAERHVVRMARGLRMRGWEPSVFCLSRQGALGLELEKLGIVVTGGVPYQGRSRIHKVLVFPQVWRYLRRTRPAIVATYLDAPNVLGPVAARLAGCRHVITSRRSFHRHRGTKSGLYRIGMRVSDALSDRVVAVSEAARSQAQSEGTPASKLVVIHNSVQLPNTVHGEGQKFVGSPVIGSVGRLHPTKGLDILIRSLARVLLDYPRAKAVLIGQGDDGSRLEAVARFEGVEDSVVFLGERHDVAELLPGFDIFVMASWHEGMPNALLEAMVSGVPVVATAVGGILEIVKDRETGLLVPPGDDRALAAGIIELVGNETLRRRLARQGKASVMERFGDVEREVSRLEKVLVDVVGASAAPARAPAAGQALASCVANVEPRMGEAPRQ